MQAQGYDGRPPKYSGMLDVLQKAFRHEGVRGLYKASKHLLVAQTACCCNRPFCSSLSQCTCADLCWAAQSSSVEQRIDANVWSQGILPNLAKVAPAAGISWFTFEEVKLLLGVDPAT